MTQAQADVVVIGAGVVGTAIARTLARYRLDLVLVDAAPDVGTGTSKANTAILHTGFDAKPGTLESRLLSRGSALLRSYAAAAASYAFLSLAAGGLIVTLAQADVPIYAWFALAVVLGFSALRAFGETLARYDPLD